MTTTYETARARATAARASRSANIAAFVAGGLAAALAIAVAELIAGLIADAPSLVIAIGDLVISLQPAGGKELFVGLFGEADKLALNVIIVGAAILIAGVLGVAGRRDWNIPLVGFLIAGLVALVAALARPLTDPVLAALTVAVSVLASLAALRVMLTATGPAWRAAAASSRPAGEATEGSGTAGTMPDWDRRRFLQVSGGVAVGSVLLGVLGRNLLEARASAPTETAELPTLVTGSAPTVPAGASLDVEGITPLVVPTDRFYRIDTALVPPRVDVADWSLTLRGMVDREVTLTYDDLAAMPLFEQYVTIACVSNEVGGRLVGNALWTGVDLREVLDMAGVQPGATQIVGHSVDGFTAGFPTSWAMDPERRPMIALAMNGETLPVDHGYPARLIVPGLYGYVSATKWLSEIELTTLEGFDAYWIPRGWAKEAPILTQSRIDVPARGTSVAAGATVPIAGVAWAPDRGISRVEVSVDGTAWQEARLSQPLNDATWVQWMLPWEAGQPGRHHIAVRATDGEGETQTDQRTPPAPDGARGYHTIEVMVA